MKLLIGLGNPGSTYSGTRHNVGFDVLNRLSESLRVPFGTGKGNYLVAKAVWQGHRILLLKPTTYMNRSGHAVVAAMNFYKIQRQEMLVICDDLNLSSGSIRLRARGSAGGQNGLKHIIESLGSEEFARMRIGIRLQDQLLTSFSPFVLGRFSDAEKKTLESVFPFAADAALDFVANGIEHAMNRYNRTVN